MSQIPMVGKGGYVEIGGEQLKLDNWTLDADKIKELNECFDDLSRAIISASFEISGFWNTFNMAAPIFAKMEARRLRRLRKKWKRYQLQKRKQ